MDKILFIVRSYSRIGAQPIRFRQILQYLKSDFEIHVIELTHGPGGVRSEDGVFIHALPYSKIGRMFNPPDTYRKRINSRVDTNLFSKILLPFKRFVRYLLFPDSLVTEGVRIKREAQKLVNDLKCKTVIISAFPFTTLVCARSIKSFTQSKIILDIGDPFYKNSRNGFLKDVLARVYEKTYLKYVDNLVVTNNLTREHYLKTYGSLLLSKQVVVIEQGVSEELLSDVSKYQKERTNYEVSEFIRLVYAGQLYRNIREPYELYKAIEKIGSLKNLHNINLHMYGSYSKEFLPNRESSKFVIIKGQIPYESLIRVYLSADIIVFIDNAYGLQTPGKIFEIASLNKPVLFISDNPESPANEVVKELKHFYFTENKSEGIVRTIQRMLIEITDIQNQNYMEVFSWRKRADKYRKTIEDLIGQ